MTKLLAPLCPDAALGELCESPDCEGFHPADLAQAAAEHQKKGTRKICYFHHLRKCNRADCKYLHVAPASELAAPARPIRPVPPTVRAASQLRGVFKEIDARKKDGAEDLEYVARVEAWERAARDQLYRITNEIRRAAVEEGLLPEDAAAPFGAAPRIQARAL